MMESNGVGEGEAIMLLGPGRLIMKGKEDDGEVTQRCDQKW
jgi:hypothetical protein